MKHPRGLGDHLAITRRRETGSRAKTGARGEGELAPGPYEGCQGYKQVCGCWGLEFLFCCNVCHKAETAVLPLQETELDLSGLGPPLFRGRRQ